MTSYAIQVLTALATHLGPNRVAEITDIIYPTTQSEYFGLDQIISENPYHPDVELLKTIVCNARTLTVESQIRMLIASLAKEKSPARMDQLLGELLIYGFSTMVKGKIDTLLSKRLHEALHDGFARVCEQTIHSQNHDAASIVTRLVWLGEAVGVEFAMSDEVANFVVTHRMASV